MRCSRRDLKNASQIFSEIRWWLVLLYLITIKKKFSRIWKKVILCTVLFEYFFWAAFVSKERHLGYFIESFLILYCTGNSRSNLWHLLLTHFQPPFFWCFQGVRKWNIWKRGKQNIYQWANNSKMHFFPVFHLNAPKEYQ